MLIEGNTPVYIMMKPKEQYEICLISIMDLMVKNLMDRNKDNRSRLHRLERLHKLLMEIEQRYEGALPDAMVNKADRFNKLICADLESLVRLVGEK